MNSYLILINKNKNAETISMFFSEAKYKYLENGNVIFFHRIMNTLVGDSYLV